MSAICGIYQHKNTLSPLETVTQMAAALQHRGRDGHGVWASPKVGLAHLMLHTTPESLYERQPYTHDLLTITADARIDNRDELISVLALRPSGTAPITDMDIIAAAYQRWGIECVKRLLGAFALAIWDETENRLFLARDPIGVKPLYIAWKAPYFAFATEIKGLLTLSFISHEIDRFRVADHLAALVNESERTFYADIQRLPPAHCLEIRDGQKRTWAYWSPENVASVRYPSPADYVDGFREQFERAVKVNMRSAFPIGAALSGGLDSSSVVGAARTHQHGETLYTYSVVYPRTPASDESAHIHAVIDQGGVKAHIINGDEESTLIDDANFFTLEEPHLAANLFMTWRIYEAAARDGVRVVLDGLDGDTTLSHGVGYLAELISAGEWNAFESALEKVRAGWDQHQAFSKRPFYQAVAVPRLPEFLRTGRLDKFTRALVNIHRETGISYAGLIARDTVFAALPHRARWWVRRMKNPAQFRKSYRVFNDAFYRESLGHLRQREQEMFPALRPDDSMREHAALIRNGAIPLTCEWVDRMAGHFGIEARHPFFDARLVTYCLGLPGTIKLVDGVSRWVLRESMRGVLPDSVRNRQRKSNLSYSFTNNFYAHDFSAAMQNRLRNSARLAEYTDTKVINLLIQRALHEPENNTVAYQLWSLLVFSLWGDKD